MDSNYSRETQQARRLALVSRRDVVEPTPSVRVEPGRNPGNSNAGVAVPAFDAQEPPARGSDIPLKNNIGDDTESNPSEADQQEPLTPRAEDIDFSSAEESDEEVLRQADESTGTVAAEVEVEEPRGPRLRAAFLFLDTVDPIRIFRQRGAVVKSAPQFVKKPFRNASKFALEEASASATSERLEVVDASTSTQNVVAPWPQRRFGLQVENGGAVPILLTWRMAESVGGQW